MSRQLELTVGAAEDPEPSSDDGTELPSVAMVAVVVGVVALVDSTGTMTKPRGSRGMQDGSSPLMASWMASTSIVV